MSIECTEGELSMYNTARKFTKANLINSKRVFSEIDLERLGFNYPRWRVFFATVLDMGGGLYTHWNSVTLRTENKPFINWFCSNYDEINDTLSSVKEWCVVRDMLYSEETPSFYTVAEKYSCQYNMFYILSMYAYIVSNFFRSRGDSFYCVNPMCIDSKEYQYVSPLFLGVSPEAVRNLNTHGISTIAEIIFSYAKSGETAMDDYLGTLKVSDPLDKMAITDYIEKGVYDPEYYSTVVSLDYSRLFYVVGKCIKYNNGIIIKEDTSHPKSYTLYTPGGETFKRVLLEGKVSIEKLEAYKKQLDEGKDALECILTLI